MFFSHSTTSAEGIAVTHHQLARVEIRGDFGTVQMWIDSWPTEAARLAGNPPVARWYVQAEASGMSFGSGLPAALSAAVLASDAFSGATAIGDSSVGLAAAQERKWAEMKAARTAEETGGFTWDGSTFDSDYLSQTRIQGAVLMAKIAADASAAFSIDWTLADNTVRTLDAADMIAVGQALAAHVQAAFAQGRDLYDDIEAATTVAMVDAVVWP